MRPCTVSRKRRFAQGRTKRLIRSLFPIYGAYHKARIVEVSLCKQRSYPLMIGLLGLTPLLGALSLTRYREGR